ncbi:MAG: hypothetical protein KKA79_03735 [Nanoarchaeota archaeon]|nr:hypothetical protein [Nanoarchaeota archaeon]MCG2718367.1 hypothetical protein [Nanoarchaeota archaeon]
MVNEIIEAFQMACSNNPDLQMEDVEKIFIDEIENILPEIIKQINLPPKQTLLDRRKEEFHLKRMKSKYREKRVKRTQPREILIEGLRVVQYHLNGHDTQSNMLFDINDSRGMLSNDGVQIYDSHSNFDQSPIRRVKDLIEEDRGNTWKQIRLRNIAQEEYKPLGLDSGLTLEHMQRISLPPNIKIVVESSVKRKCKKDTLLKELIDIIKHEVVNIPELQNKNYDVKLSIVRDIELPEWEKLVVSFDIPELGFDEKIIMWDIIDKQIRKVVHELPQARHPYTTRTRYYKDLNKNLFLKMRLT